MGGLKNRLKSWLKERWFLPPQERAEFVRHGGRAGSPSPSLLGECCLGRFPRSGGDRPFIADPGTPGAEADPAAVGKNRRGRKKGHNVTRGTGKPDNPREEENMTTTTGRERAGRQWTADTTQAEAELRRGENRPQSEADWVQAIHEAVGRIPKGQSRVRRTYAPLPEIYALIRIWSRDDLIPRIGASPHRIICPQVLDFEEDIKEERWGEYSPSYPPSSPGLAKNRTGPEDLQVTHKQWKRRIDAAMYWIENTLERDQFNVQAMGEQLDLPPYIPYQIVQNYYNFALPLAAMAWVWGEALIRTRQTGIQTLPEGETGGTNG